MERKSRDRLPWGNGLVLFRPGTPASKRRRRLAFCALVLALGTLLIWPLYAFVSPIEPKLLGLPFGIVWVVGALVAMFVGVLTLYRDDLRDGEE